MNDSVKNVIFYSTRQIHPYFSDKKHLIPSKSLIEYFSGLLKKDNTKDEFSRWLSDLAFWSYYQQELDDICEAEDRQKLTELLSIVIQTKDRDPRSTVSVEKCLESHMDEDLFWTNACSIFAKLQINEENNVISFKPSLFDEYKERILSGKTTHLNRDLTESKSAGGNPDEEYAKLKHRLGIYHKEDDYYAVAAIWPWADEMEEDHDIKWKTVAVKAIKELYPKCEEIILVMHDNDFANLKDNEKNTVLWVRRKLSQMNDPDAQSDSTPSVNDPLISLITFQHTNRNVLEPIQKEDKYSPKQVWELINGYINRDSLSIIQMVDNDNIVAQMHDSTDKA